MGLNFRRRAVWSQAETLAGTLGLALVKVAQGRMWMLLISERYRWGGKGKVKSCVWGCRAKRRRKRMSYGACKKERCNEEQEEEGFRSV